MMPRQSTPNFSTAGARRVLPTPVRGSAWKEPGAGMTVWFTGLSGAGKSTLASALGKRLRKADVPTVVLDADALRKGFCAGLGFSREDRTENVRRIAELSRRLTKTGAVVLVAAIAPYRDVRMAARDCIGEFLEVYVNAPLATCIERDPKGLYARAIAGEIPQFTGISDPYEEPLSPDLECRTDVESVAACTEVLFALVMARRQQGLLSTSLRG
jgi:adenylylsulfate kinase